jgi:hypothetical protein
MTCYALLEADCRRLEALSGVASAVVTDRGQIELVITRERVPPSVLAIVGCCNRGILDVTPQADALVATCA